ncbi:hypothetical protein BU26DRAFT_565029 [Trematosphaeria pertusa]|uniref:F-box domain-containing protein n=1 Tax=Trematosphaeria pertusa TaxID=390896 RepID=A0A6A6IGS6_9PLEO|nr:uncharacterized protein BU26DRAFT_565029 [Trematosphaeria pertusa]KAF2249377.1 hypothetical protein BU26DRAFT_565029 [Trematosphaeria pertusa]
MIRTSVLPEELLLNILEDLRGDSRTLASVCRASKTLNRIAIPLLYHTISLHGLRTKGAIALLIRTFYEHPSLTEHLRIFSLTVFRYDYDDGGYPSMIDELGHLDDFGHIDELEYFKKLCLDSMNRFVTDSDYLEMISDDRRPSKRWLITHELRGSERWRDQALLAGLLLLFLGDRTIDVTVAAYENPSACDVTTSIFGCLYDLEPRNPYNALYDITVRPALHHWARNVERLNLLSTTLPLLGSGFDRLKTLEVKSVLEWVIEDEPRFGNDLRLNGMVLCDADLPFRHLNTLILHSHWSELDDLCLLPVLLEKLGWPRLANIALYLDHGPRKRTEPIRRDPGFDVAVRNMDSVADTLEDLTIQVNKASVEEGWFDIASLGRFLAIQTLSRFTRLRKLTVPREAIVHYDNGVPSLGNSNIALTLPPSLQEITISHPDEEVLTWLGDLCGVRELGYLENLSKITLACGSGWGKPAAWFEQSHHVLENLRAEGIAVETVTW